MTYNPPARHNSASKIHDRPRASVPQFLHFAYFFSLALSAMAWVALPPVRRPVRRAAMRPTCAQSTPHLVSTSSTTSGPRTTLHGHSPSTSGSLPQTTQATAPWQAGSCAGSSALKDHRIRPYAGLLRVLATETNSAAWQGSMRIPARWGLGFRVSHPPPGICSAPSPLDPIPTSPDNALLSASSRS